MLQIDHDLLIAAANGQVADVAMLLAAGANVNASDESGKTALIWAAHQGYEDVVLQLIESGADVNLAETQHGVTGLMLAAHHGHKAVVKVLLSETDKGADKAMLLAAKRGHKHIVKLIQKSRKIEGVY